jgi:hypothetical protein
MQLNLKGKVVVVTGKYEKYPAITPLLREFI